MYVYQSRGISYPCLLQSVLHVNAFTSICMIWGFPGSDSASHSQS